MRRFALVVCLVGCSSTPSNGAVGAGPEQTAPNPSQASPPAEPGCEPRVSEVLFVTDGSGFSVTILGEGFCKGAGLLTAKFGDVEVTDIVVASSGQSLAGRVDRTSPSGEVLEIHTPPGNPVVTDYEVP